MLACVAYGLLSLESGGCLGPRSAAVPIRKQCYSCDNPRGYTEYCTAVVLLGGHRSTANVKYRGVPQIIRLYLYLLRGYVRVPELWPSVLAVGMQHSRWRVRHHALRTIIRNTSLQVGMIRLAV